MCIRDRNSWFQNQYIMKPEVYNYLGSVHIGAGGMNRAVSESCDQAYTQTPRINHELINRHEPSSQICKARNAILQRMLDLSLIHILSYIAVVRQSFLQE